MKIYKDSYFNFMDAHRLRDELQIFFVLPFLEGNYEFLLHERNKVPYHFPHHLKVMRNVFLLSCCMYTYLPNISYVHWNASATVAYRGGVWGVQTPPPPKFRRYRWSPRSHKQEEPASQFPFAVHCVLIRFNLLNKGFF